MRGQTSAASPKIVVKEGPPHFRQQRLRQTVGGKDERAAIVNQLLHGENEKLL